MFQHFEKYDMLKCFIEANENIALSLRMYHDRYPERRQPSGKIFSRLKQNLISHGSFTKPRPKTYRNLMIDKELEELTVLGEINLFPNTSTRAMERNTGVARTTVRRIFKKHKFRPYRLRKVHHLRQQDFAPRRAFSHWFLRKCQDNPNFSTNVIWSDEATITSDGIFTRYNCYYWEEENQHRVIEHVRQGRYSFKVWVGFYRGRIIGPFLFDGNLNSQRYLQILQDHLVDFIDNLPLEERMNCFFQQDGAPPHNTREISGLLNELFGVNWIGNRAPIYWPPRSPDLTPCDFFLWGQIKDMVYRHQTNNIQELKNTLRQAFRRITPVMLLNAANNVKKRCRLCLRQNGRQFEHRL